MTVTKNVQRQLFTLPGLAHQTLAGQADGLAGVEVWLQTIAPGGETPVHWHECEEVVVVLRGAGCLTVAGEATEFGADTTLIVPPHTVHQIVNTADDDMLIVAVLSETPARVFSVDDKLLALPWFPLTT